ncbi:MAG TPA: cytochrome P450 [Nostocaceae cyanobacterium]|nr:cytochrome P450 [Nostocaceae cyanobacterium]
MQLPNQLKIPSFLQSFLFITDPTAFLDKTARKYPDIFSGDLVGKNTVMLFHPQAAKEVFAYDRTKFDLVEKTEPVRPIVGDNALMTLAGQTHKRHRKLLMPQFHKDRMLSYGEKIVELVERAMDKLSLNQPFTAHSITQEISMNTMIQVVFGDCKAEKYQQLRHILTLWFNYLRSPLYTSFLWIPFLRKDLGSWSPWGKFIRLRQEIDEWIYSEITERRTHPNPEYTDILSLLIEAKDEEGHGMSDQEIRDEVMALAFGGQETTSISMAWALYWTHYLPEVGEKVRQELDSLNGCLDTMSIFKLPYLDAVCNETLRLSGAGIVTSIRVVGKEAVELLGHRLEPGTKVVVCPYLLHRREDIYPKAEQFIPERFLNREYSPYEFITFGGGARRCIGEALSRVELKLVLATILSRYQLTLANREPEKLRPQGLALGPGNGVRMLLKGRLVHQELRQAVETF